MDCACAFLTTGDAPDNRLVFALLAGLNREQCCLRIVDMTLIGSEHAPSARSAGEHPNETKPERAELLQPHLYRARFWSSGSPTRLRNVGVSQLATTNLQPTTRLHSTCIHPAVGCGLMNPRHNWN